MASYFIVSINMEEPEGAGEYREYIRLVKPIVEAFGGRYLVRTEQIAHVGGEWRPDRVIVIRFPDRRALEACFGSEVYRRIAQKREMSVNSSAVIVEGENDEDM